MTFWLSRNHKGYVIGSGDKELIQFLVEDIEFAKKVLAAIKYQMEKTNAE